MRIIQLRVDDKMFLKIKKDKEKMECDSWEDYITYLFGFDCKDQLNK